MSKLMLGRYTRRELWTLFLICALPFHIWTLILGFRDMPWVAERTNMWDAIGVLSYGLLFALVESALVFLVVVLLGFIVPRQWEPGRRVALMGLFSLILAMWAIVDHAFFLSWLKVPPSLIGLLAQGRHPLRNLYAIALVLVGASFALPAWAAMRNGRGLNVMRATLDRLGVLSTLYLILDIPALIIVIIRNL